MTKYKKLFFLTGTGIALEYYDFVIYGLLLKYLAQAFFSLTDQKLSMTAFFSIVLATGYFARPIGGAVLGFLGDKLGRKPILLSTTMGMGIITFCVGCLPTYSAIGFASIFLLIVLRFFQGVCYSAEVPGTAILLTEHFKNHQGIYCGLMLAAISIGAIIASLVVSLLHLFLSDEQIISWGWRLPFLFGGSLGFVSYFIRKQITETPIFISIKKKNNFREQLVARGNNFFIKTLYAVSVGLLPATLIIFSIFMPTYLSDYVGYEIRDVYLSLTFGLLCTVFVSPLFGFFLDRFNHYSLVLCVAILVIIFIYPLFYLVTREITWINLMIFTSGYEVILAMANVCSVVILANLFIPEIRFTFFATCYNIAYLLAALTPLVSSVLVQFTASTTSVSIIFVLLATNVALFTVYFRKKCVRSYKLESEIQITLQNET